jgi:hypothetical protein
LEFYILRSSPRPLQYPIYTHRLVVGKKQRIVRTIMLLVCFLCILCCSLGHGRCFIKYYKTVFTFGNQITFMKSFHIKLRTYFCANPYPAILQVAQYRYLVPILLSNLRRLIDYQTQFLWEDVSISIYFIFLFSSSFSYLFQLTYIFA